MAGLLRKQMILFAYVDGSDLDEIAESLEAEFEDFVERSRWRNATPNVVNQRFDDDASLKPGDRPDWQIGLNVEFDASDGLDDVERIARFLGDLHSQTGCDFVIGLEEGGVTEDLFYVDTNTPDLDAMRRAIAPRR